MGVLAGSAVFALFIQTRVYVSCVITLDRYIEATSMPIILFNLSTGLPPVQDASGRKFPIVLNK